MNIYKLITIALCLALATVIIKQNSTMNNTTLETIHSRKSVRSYTDQLVNMDQIDTLLHAGMAAPTARNIQPWEFVVINDTTLLTELGDSLKTGRPLRQVNKAILIVANMNDVENGAASKESWIQDCSACSQNILLAAESIGLGALWIGLYPYEDRIADIRSVLNLPNHLIPLNIIAVGYSTGKDQPKDKWKPEKIHYNKF